MRLNTEAVAGASSRHPWTIVGLWIVVVVVALALSSAVLGDALTTDIAFTDDPEAERAARLVEDRLRPVSFTEIVVVESETATVSDPALAEYVEVLRGAVVSLGGEVVNPERVVTYREVPTLLSQDGHSTLISVSMAADTVGEVSTDAEELMRAVDGVPPPEGVRALLVGPGTFNNEFNTLAEETLRTGETFGAGIALIVLLVVIGAVVAAVLPLILAIAAIALALGATALIGQAFEMSFFVTNMITMIGLAVGIDYSLFIVARYREERARGHEKLDAIARSAATAGRAVFFSGMTVVLALLGMFIMPNTLFRSLATGAIVVVIFAVLASTTLLPAVFSLLGDKINALPVRRRDALANIDKVGGMWDRLTRTVMARSVAFLTVGLLFLGGIAFWYLSLETGFGGVSALPEDSQAHEAFTTLEQNFPGGLTEPVEVVVNDTVTPAVRADIESLQTAMMADGSFGPATTEVSPSGDLALVTAPLIYGDTTSQAAVDAVRRLRGEIVPASFAGSGADVLVGGSTAFTVDFFDDVDTFTPIVFVFVLGLSFLLLTVVFRSLVVPVKAILLNLLSVGAAYGMMVLFFQEGVGPGWVKDIASALGFRQVEAIEAWLPLMLFSVLFGLSMDYHVFLLTRIREAYDRTGSNTEAVAHGLRTTGAIITGAALIMVAVFGGFAAGDLVAFQQMGFGLAVAVFLDATIIRSILVPATMRLLGDRNWWLPGWLGWLPELDVEGHEAAEVHHAATQKPHVASDV
jgi:RND superfamily putative drug exporter